VVVQIIIIIITITNLFTVGKNVVQNIVIPTNYLSKIFCLQIILKNNFLLSSFWSFMKSSFMILYNQLFMSLVTWLLKTLQMTGKSMKTAWNLPPHPGWSYHVIKILAEEWWDPGLPCLAHKLPGNFSVNLYFFNTYFSCWAAFNAWGNVFSSTSSLEIAE